MNTIRFSISVTHFRNRWDFFAKHINIIKEELASASDGKAFTMINDTDRSALTVQILPINLISPPVRWTLRCRK